MTCVTDIGDPSGHTETVPRYTHLIVSSQDRDRLSAAQDRGTLVAGVRAEVHCQNITEAAQQLLEYQADHGAMYAIITLRLPIEY